MQLYTVDCVHIIYAIFMLYANCHRQNVLGSMEVSVHVCVCTFVCMHMCVRVHVCVVAYMCMYGDQIVPGHSSIGSGGQTPCSYLLTVLNHNIDRCCMY